MTLWTEQETEICTTLWEQGGSAGQIADAIGTKSRSAVSGWLARSGRHRNFAIKPKPDVLAKPRRKHRKQLAEISIYKAQTAIKTTRQLIAATFSAAHLPPARLDRTPCQLLDLEEDSCRFPLGDGVAVWFCNQKQIEGTSYCTAHCRIVFQPPRPR